MRAAVLCLVIGSGFLAGCATLARGTIDNYNISSEPSGALATTSLGTSCRTPCSIMINRRDRFTVTVALAGYRPQQVEVDTRLSSSGVSHAVENLGNAGVGVAIDAATGATLEHFPGQVSVVLKPQ